MKIQRPNSLLLRHGAPALAAWLAIASPSFGATTNWIAFNDHAPGSTAGWVTSPNATTNNMRGVSGGNAGTILSGPLKDIDTGATLAAVLTSSATGAPNDLGSMSYPNAGTDAYNLFMGKVDLSNIQSGIGVTAPGKTVTLTISGLDPTKRYVFKGTSVRGNNYTRRWTLVTIQGADSFVPDHSAAVRTAGNYPSGGMSGDAQAAYNSGENRADGAVVGWKDINPGADGTFSILCEQWNPTVLPSGETADLANYGYAICAMMLAEVEVGTPLPPSITTQPVGVNTNEGGVAILGVSATGSGNLTYQWYRNNSPVAAPRGTQPTLTVTNLNGASIWPWSNPSDAGTYHVVVTGSVNPPAESQPVVVNVSADTTPPHFEYALCGSGDSETVVYLNERIAPATLLDLTDQFAWHISTLDGNPSDDLQLQGDPVYAVNGNTATLTFTHSPRNLLKSYKVIYDSNGNTVLDTAATPNPLTAGSSVGVRCATNHLVTLGKAWKYLDDDTDPGVNWAQPGFVDTAWPTGAGPFDAKRDQPDPGGHCRVTTLYGLGNVGTCINLTSPVTLTNLVAANFRTHFTFSGNPSQAILRLNGKVDDAAVVYLNGIEIWRIGIGSPSTRATFASRTVNDTDAQDELTLAFPAPLLAGDNVLAVELHQVNLTSSDLTMGLEVASLDVEAAPVAPTLTIIPGGGNVTITWTPAQGQLQYKDNITDANWTLVTPAPAAGGPYVVPASEAHRFYSLRQ